MRPAPHGLWVEWDAYLLLKTENERLKNNITVGIVDNSKLEYMNKGKSHQDWVDGKDFTK